MDNEAIAGLWSNGLKPIRPSALDRIPTERVSRGGNTVQAIQQRETGECRFGSMIGRSASMLAVFDQIDRVAATNATVLIIGESGTGKELVARAIYDCSGRRNGPYSVMNMAAVPETLVESELFGHTRGSFTDAGASRCGRFEACDGGTLFIDEIGDLKMSSQAKLLRVLEDRRITPIGSNHSKAVDVRMIAATSRNLDRMMAEGKFREDLYYRLNVVAIWLPPLRNRRDDIPALVRHFLAASVAANRRPPCELDEGLWWFLETYHWPGNVRQLRNCIESMVVLARSPTLTVDDLPAMVRTAPPTPDAQFKIPKGFTLEDIERVVVRQTLCRSGGKRTEAARCLGMSVRTLQRKLKRWQSDGSS